MTRTGIEQLGSAVCSGGQKRSSGPFLERGRFLVRAGPEIHAKSTCFFEGRCFFMFYSSRSLKPGDPYGNCCAGDRRLRRKQGAGAGAAVAEGKPCVGAQPDAYPQPDKARVRRLCWCRTSGPFYWPLFAACLFRNQRCALVFASRLRGIARHNRAGKKLQWTVFRAREIPRTGRT